MSAYPPVPGVLQTGMVTPGHAAVWTTNGVIQDAGGSAFMLPSVANGLIGMGTTQATALPLTSGINVASSVPVNSGFLLPSESVSGSPLPIPTIVTFYNRSVVANVASVYPGVGFEIESLGVNNPFGIAQNSQVTFTLVSATQWLVS